jgi:hypothetical protein
MVDDVMAHRAGYGDFEQDAYYNIRVFKAMTHEAVHG